MGSKCLRGIGSFALLMLLNVSLVLFPATGERLDDGTVAPDSLRRIQAATKKLFDCFQKEAKSGLEDLRGQIKSKCHDQIQRLQLIIQQELGYFPLLTRCRHGVFLINPFDMYISQSLLVYGQWMEDEVNLLASIVAPNATVLQYGGNIGAHTVPLARMVGPTGVVIAVEPSRFNHQYLCANAIMNFHSNIFALHAVLGNVNGILRHRLPPLRFPDNFGGYGPSGVEAGAAVGEDYVTVTSVDMLDLDGLHLLILHNTDASIPQVIQGAETTLRRLTPAVYFSGDQEASRTDASAILESWGYVCREHRMRLFDPQNYRLHESDIFAAVATRVLCTHSARPAPPPYAAGDTHSLEPVMGQRGPVVCNTGTCLVPPSSPEGMSAVDGVPWRGDEVSDVIMQFVPNTANVLQVGSDAGSVLVPLAHRVRSKRGQNTGQVLVLCDGKAFRLLGANLALNNVTNVRILDLPGPFESTPQAIFGKGMNQLLPAWLREGHLDFIRVEMSYPSAAAIIRSLLVFQAKKAEEGDRIGAPNIYIVDWCLTWAARPRPKPNNSASGTGDPPSVRQPANCPVGGDSEDASAVADSATSTAGELIRHGYKCYTHIFDHPHMKISHSNLREVNSAAGAAGARSVNLLCLHPRSTGNQSIVPGRPRFSRLGAPKKKSTVSNRKEGRGTVVSPQVSGSSGGGRGGDMGGSDVSTAQVQRGQKRGQQSGASGRGEDAGGSEFQGRSASPSNRAMESQGPAVEVQTGAAREETCEGGVGHACSARNTSKSVKGPGERPGERPSVVEPGGQTQKVGAVGREIAEAGEEAAPEVANRRITTRDTAPLGTAVREWGTQATETEEALNFADQSRLYPHHTVYSRMQRRAQSVDPLSVTEATGLRVPRAYDCGNLDPGGGRLAGHAYFVTNPARWIPCYHLEALVRAGQRIFVPEWHAIDEEYLEAAAVYESALDGRGRFAMAELGARWGTWGFRAAAAIRAYNEAAVTKLDLLFVEPERDACLAIANVARLNKFESPRHNITIDCNVATYEGFVAWAQDKDVIDLVDVDIQGGEYTLLPALAGLFNAKVRRLIVGTHQEEDESLLGLFPGWRVLHRMPFAGPERCRAQVLRRGRHWGDQAELARAECRATAWPTRFGPIFQWDGELILDNPALA